MIYGRYLLSKTRQSLKLTAALLITLLFGTFGNFFFNETFSETCKDIGSRNFLNLPYFNLEPKKQILQNSKNSPLCDHDKKNPIFKNQETPQKLKSFNKNKDPLNKSQKLNKIMENPYETEQPLSDLKELGEPLLNMHPAMSPIVEPAPLSNKLQNILTEQKLKKDTKKDNKKDTKKQLGKTQSIMNSLANSSYLQIPYGSSLLSIVKEDTSCFDFELKQFKNGPTLKAPSIDFAKSEYPTFLNITGVTPIHVKDELHELLCRKQKAQREKEMKPESDKLKTQHNCFLIGVCGDPQCPLKKEKLSFSRLR